MLASPQQTQSKEELRLASCVKPWKVQHLLRLLMTTLHRTSPPMHAVRQAVPQNVHDQDS